MGGENVKVVLLQHGQATGADQTLLVDLCQLVQGAAAGVIVQLSTGQFHPRKQHVQILPRPELVHPPQRFAVAHDTGDQALDHQAGRDHGVALIPARHPIDSAGDPGQTAEFQNNRHPLRRLRHLPRQQQG